eukprot:EG_transcript_8490
MAVLLTSILLQQHETREQDRTPRLSVGLGRLSVEQPARRRTPRAAAAAAAAANREVPVAVVAPADDAAVGPVEGTVVHDPNTCALRRLDAKPRRYWGIVANDGTNLFVHKKIGAGTHSYIYHCQDREDGREYAIKLVPMDHSFEPARCVLDGMEHENIVKCHDHFRFLVGRVPYMGIKMDYCRNGSLREYLQRKADRGRPVRPEVIADYMAQVAIALSYIHRQGRIHGDLCPENILRTGSGPLKLSGFSSGLNVWRGDEGHMTVTGGRLAYAPPEWQTTAVPHGHIPQVDASYDLWALGLVLSEMVTLRPLPERLQAPPRPAADADCVTGILQEMVLAHGGMFTTLAGDLLAEDTRDRPAAASIPAALPDLPSPETKWWQKPLTALYTARNV